MGREVVVDKVGKVRSSEGGKNECLWWRSGSMRGGDGQAGLALDTGVVRVETKRERTA